MSIGKMLGRSTISAILLVALGGFAAGTVHASQKALFSMEYRSFGFAGLAGGNNNDLQRFAETPAPGGVPFSATVETGSGASPSPSVMWPANIISEMSTATAGGTITPSGMENPSAYGIYFSFVQVHNNFNKVATMMKSGGLTANTTINWPATTTICNNTCLPRNGTAFQSQTPGSNRYGGTARVLDQAVSTGLKKNFVLGGFTQQLFNIVYTPMATAPVYNGGAVGKAGTVVITTPNSGTYSSPIHMLNGRYSTGQARAMLTINAYNTTATKTGSVNVNTANLTGTISLVKPQIQLSWRKVGGTVISVGSGNNFAVVNSMNATFLPEPSQFAMLGAGILGIGVLYRRRFF